jgi:protein ImuB
MVVAVALDPPLPVQAAWWSEPALRRGPLALALPGGRLSAVCPQAALSGCVAGQTPGQARLCCPDLCLRVPDGLAATFLWQAALAALGTVSPVVETGDSEGGVAYLAAAGLERLWGDGAAVAARALTTLAGVGVQALAGAGPTRATALALAHRMERAGPRSVAGDEARALLATLPVDDPALGVPPAVQVALGEVGITHGGDLAALPLAALTLRFGLEIAGAWHRARGEGDPPLQHSYPPEALTVAECLEDGLADTERLGALVEILSSRLARLLEERGQATGLLTLLLGCDDGRRLPRQSHHPLPLAAQDVLARAARRLLGEIHPSSPVAEVCLRADALCLAPVDAVGLWAAPGPGKRADRLGTVLAAHTQRYGETRLRRLRRDPLSREGWRWDEVHGAP